MALISPFPSLAPPSGCYAPPLSRLCPPLRRLLSANCRPFAQPAPLGCLLPGRGRSVGGFGGAITLSGKEFLEFGENHPGTWQLVEVVLEIFVIAAGIVVAP